MLLIISDWIWPVLLTIGQVPGIRMCNRNLPRSKRVERAAALDGGLLVLLYEGTCERMHQRCASEMMEVGIQITRWGS